MDLHTIAGTLCGIMLVVELGWRNAAVVIVLMGGFLTLAFAVFSSWIVVFVLLVMAAIALRLVRHHRANCRRKV